MASMPSESIVEADDSIATSSVKATMEKASRIATLPAVAVRIIQLCNDPETTIEELLRIIDPVLGAKILRLVNSAYYGVPGQIKSIKHAILMLGLNAIKNIAIAASLVKLARGGRVGPSFHASDLWDHCVAVATAARLMAQKTQQVPADEAFLAGLIHDIGIIVELQTSRDEFIRLLDQLAVDPQLTFRAAEMQCLGATHENLGAELCAAWNFPQSLRLAVGYHHRPWELPESVQRLPSLIHVADLLATRAGIGYARTVETDVLAPELQAQLSLEDADLAEIVERLPEAMQEAGPLLSDNS